MSVVVVERSFEAAADLPELQAKEDAVAWCLEARNVAFQYTLFSRDRQRMVCFYEAPDAEAVRHAQDKGGLPYDRIWSAEVCPGEGHLGLQPKRVHVVVQRELPRKFTMAEYAAAGERADDCLMRHRARFLNGFLAPDGRTTICHFEAIDAESIRRVNEETQIPYVHIWPGTLHQPA